MTGDLRFGAADVSRARPSATADSFQCDLGDERDLRLEPIDVLLGVVEDRLQDIARDVVADRLAVGDAVLDRLLRARFDCRSHASSSGTVSPISTLPRSCGPADRWAWRWDGRKCLLQIGL
jgi:hypothetical protein